MKIALFRNKSYVNITSYVAESNYTAYNVIVFEEMVSHSIVLCKTLIVISIT